MTIQNIGVLENSSNYSGTLNLHMSPKAIAWMRRYCELCGELFGGKTRIETLCEKGILRLCEVKPYECNTVGDRRVFAVESNHRGYGDGEFALNYIIEEKDGRRFMYATDTGLYSDENIAALSGFGCSTLVMEGTNGSRDTPITASHLNAKNFVENVRRFKDNGILTPDAWVYVTHINQVNKFSHDEYQAYIRDELGERAFVAYDGMEI